MSISKGLRRSPRMTIVVVAAVVCAVVAAVAYGATVPAIQTTTPNHADQVTNIDVLRQQIRNYYGDPMGTGVFSPDSNYAQEAASVAAQGGSWLQARAHANDGAKTKAIVLDVDDTTLVTWNYELASNWAYDATKNAAYVNGELFPAVPGMVDMVNRAKAEGYAVIFLTGRPTTQEATTLGNLTDSDTIGLDAGYPTPDLIFTKPATADYPPYLQTACADMVALGKSCTTIEYKSATRSYIETLGYDIVANFGDQYSDFTGGYADKTFKLPNPNYYLP
ncbi:MAG TPA: HAD family acid phosphatase [Gaiellaceae bacterium]|nr:HAD family acid phosphatase [Gaiellaceae bacterium]